MKITGIGVIEAGQYSEEISVCGSGKITGNITATSFKCSGALKSMGDIIVSGDVKISGSMRSDNNIKGVNINVSGSCTAEGNVIAEKEITVSGTLRSDGIIKASKITVMDTVSAKAGIEAEEIKISGRIYSDGLINAETIDMSLEHAENKVFGIGGGEINIYPGKTSSFVNKVPILSKIVGCNIGTLEVTDAVEGDTVKVSYTKCPTVTGRVVEIGAGCEIECVKYSDSINIHESAKVGRFEKV